MQTATAEQIRKRRRFITVPGTTPLLIEVQTPDVLAMIAHDGLPLAIFADVLDVIAKWAREGEGPDLLAHATQAPKVWGDFIDRWVCAAAVSPVIVLDEAAALKDPSKLWVDELDLNVKLEIVQTTNSPFRSPRLGDAVAEFRRLRPEGTRTGSDSTPVRLSAVD